MPFENKFSHQITIVFYNLSKKNRQMKAGQNKKYDTVTKTLDFLQVWYFIGM